MVLNSIYFTLDILTKIIVVVIGLNLIFNPKFIQFNVSVNNNEFQNQDDVQLEEI